MQTIATKETITRSERIAEERLALNAVLASPAFMKSSRHASLLEYICRKYFDGDADSIKEYSIAVDVFHRPATFDPTTESSVRVEFFRLRQKLRKYYDNEGAGQDIEIVVATGHYQPMFVDRRVAANSVRVLPEEDPVREPNETAPAGRTAYPKRTRRKLLIWFGLAAIACIMAAIPTRLNQVHSAGWAHFSSGAAPPLAVSPSGPEVRIRCGYDKVLFKDRQGKEWSGDRYFSGGRGRSIELLSQPITRTREPELFMTLRQGIFSYSIPLNPGTYELHLYFAETTYGPASQLGGGENSRVFNIQLNGKPLLTQFDIVSDAGANTADVRVFKDVHPGPDGYLRLDFTETLGIPMINAIEIVPSVPHRLNPIRMVAENNFVVDKFGNLWSPDTYVAGGQLSADRVAVVGADDPALYNGSRYGNFSYALPVDYGTYALTLYFVEKYWGVKNSNRQGPGSRVFDVQCNGTSLLRNLDIVTEAGAGHALKKTFHGLHPNAQGKLFVSLVPDVNYATVNAIQVEDETP